MSVTSCPALVPKLHLGTYTSTAVALPFPPRRKRSQLQLGNEECRVPVLVIPPFGDSVIVSDFVLRYSSFPLGHQKLQPRYLSWLARSGRMKKFESANEKNSVTPKEKITHEQPDFEENHSCRRNPFVGDGHQSRGRAGTPAPASRERDHHSHHPPRRDRFLWQSAGGRPARPRRTGELPRSRQRGQQYHRPPNHRVRDSDFRVLAHHRRGAARPRRRPVFAH